MKKLSIGILFLPIVWSNLKAQVGIQTQNPQGVFNVDAGKNNSLNGSPTGVEQADDFVVMQDGSVGIGTTEPNKSAFLDINVEHLSDGSKKGFLGPRMALNSVYDQSTISNPATGLMVYNTGSKASFPYKGYVFWDGLEWRALNGKSLAPGVLGSIKCNNVTLSPASYTSGVPYSGSMLVPYSAANGGVFPDQNIGPINGLTATLTGGNFDNGDGVLNYTISGVPTLTSPQTTVFPITIGGASCDAVVGAGNGIEPGEMIYYQGRMLASVTGWMSNYITDLPILGGKIRLDGNFSASSNQGPGAVTFNPRLVNITSEPVKIWFSAVTTVDTFNAGNYSIAPGGYVNIDNGIYFNYGFNDVLGTTNPRTEGSGGAAHQEVAQIDLSLDGRWYRIYYFPIVDNKNTVDNADNERVVYMSIQRLY